MTGRKNVVTRGIEQRQRCEVLDLDHYLEILLRKPGALPGATALVQARAAGVFTAGARGVLGPRPASGSATVRGTRALVEVLLLHRRLRHADVLAGITAALAVGSVNAGRGRGRGPQGRAAARRGLTRHPRRDRRQERGAW